jgi:hypothetical protein
MYSQPGRKDSDQIAKTSRESTPACGPGRRPASGLAMAAGWTSRRLRGTRLRLIATVAHQRRKHPDRVIVGFEHLGQALAKLAGVLPCRPVPVRIRLFPGVVQLEADS